MLSSLTFQFAEFKSTVRLTNFHSLNVGGSVSDTNKLYSSNRLSANSKTIAMLIEADVITQVS